MTPLIVHQEVEDALRGGEPVVALETAVLTHGLPRDRPAGPAPEGAPEWDGAAPLNLAAVRAMARAVRDSGAVPAVIAVLDGVIRIGLDGPDLERLAGEMASEKASAGSLAGVIARGSSAGTTVSATLTACMLPPGGPIRFFATGGIGGVHRGWSRRPDVSADLPLLGRTPVCVVCAGAKAILDLPATLEALETLAVPVVGYGTDRFPRFFTVAGDLTVSQRADDPASIARLCRVHWDVLRSPGGIVVAVPPPGTLALGEDETEAAVAEAEARAEARGHAGGARTPFVLAELARLTGDRSLQANLALLLRNARVAAEAATAFVTDGGGAPRPREQP